jgi:hypothetical protein
VNLLWEGPRRSLAITNTAERMRAGAAYGTTAERRGLGPPTSPATTWGQKVTAAMDAPAPTQ